MNNVELSPEMIRKLENGREYRNVRVQELRALDRSADDESYIVEGYATTFNQVYRLYDGEYYKIDEQIDARAFDDADMSDVIVQYNHEGRVFARTRNNTLQLTADDHGLHCRIDLGGTEIGRQLYEEIKGGYTDKMSFGFTVAEDQRTETENHETGTVTILRTITRIKKLFDVSAVSIPANDTTELSARSYCDGVIAEVEKEIFEKRKRTNKIKALNLLLEV